MTAPSLPEWCLASTKAKARQARETRRKFIPTVEQVEQIWRLIKTVVKMITKSKEVITIKTGNKRFFMC